MKNKVIALIFIILIATCIIPTITNKCQALVDVTEDQDYWKPDEEDVSDEFEEKLGNILGIVSIVGILISVGTLSVIGIKFMVASVEQKAQYKQVLLPWLIGAMLLFSLTTLPTIIYNGTNGINEIKQVQLSISQSNITLKIGENEEATLTATVTSDTERTVSWLTSNSQVATVDSKGRVTAKSAGTAIITAVVGKAKATCTVTVEAPLTTDVIISKTSVTLDTLRAKTYQLSATIIPANSIEPLYWSSSNNSVVTVQNGKIKAVGNGTATITATSGSKSATCTVQVEGSKKYFSQYYNPSTGILSSTRVSSNDLGFWICIPDISQVRDLDKLPLVIYLHGLGECGSDPGVLKNMYPFYLGSKDYPAIVIYPQCPSGSTWVSIASRIKGLIDYSIANYNVDKNKISITGYSWGGSGAWDIALKYPSLFSCVAPVSGYSSKSATTYPDCPVWVFASTGDNTAKYAQTIEKLLKNAGKKVKTSIYSCSHSAMPGTVYTEDMINWMIERSRETNSSYSF